MKKIFLSVVLLLATDVTYAQVSTTVDVENYTTSGSVVNPFAYVQVNKGFKKSSIGMFALVAATPTYVEGYVGPTVTLTGHRAGNFVQIGIAAGLETASHPYRLAGYVYFYSDADSTSTKGAWQGLINPEYGGSGYLYVGYIVRNITNTVGLGIHAQAYNGTWGMRSQYQKKGLTAYAAPGYSLEQKELGLVFGLQYSF